MGSDRSIYRGLLPGRSNDLAKSSGNAAPGGEEPTRRRIPAPPVGVMPKHYPLRAATIWRHSGPG